jgi:hypothetical protein
MFHTLFDYQDQNVPNNSQSPKTKYKKYEKKNKKGKKIYDNYYGKGNQAYELYNKKDESEENSSSSDDSGDTSQKFEKTKNKVNLIVYKNGFILNNGPFRDRAIKENEEFMEQVERGVIPHELMDKGISSLGILLINRRNEIYRPIISNHNYSIYNYNFFNPNNQYLNQNVIPITNNSIRPMPKKYNGNSIIPLGMPRINSSKNLFRTSDSKLSLKKSTKNIIRNNSGEPKDKQKKFTAFSGKGKLIGNVNVNGLHVNKSLKNMVDIFQPICNVSIRLFNGEVVKAQFNYSQTLRDIYFYVRRISGCIQFHLLDGFPPKPLRDYDKTLYELNIQNSLLTQKIYS